MSLRGQGAMELPMARDAKHAKQELCTFIPQYICLLPRAWRAQQQLCSCVVLRGDSPPGQWDGETNDRKTWKHLPQRAPIMANYVITPTLPALPSLCICSLLIFGVPLLHFCLIRPTHSSRSSPNTFSSRKPCLPLKSSL